MTLLLILLRLVEIARIAQKWRQTASLFATNCARVCANLVLLIDHDD
ncbi:hypothetical protein [Neptunicella sp.]